MRLLSEGREDVNKVWGRPQLRDTSYRWMRYLVEAKVDEGLLLLNVVTGALIILTDLKCSSVQDISPSELPDRDELIAYHYIVPDDYDEVKSVNQLRKVLQKVHNKTNITDYTILPTTACNARCFYCYESDYPRHTMTQETANKVVEYIASKCGVDKRVSLHWFGGEPTLCEDRIDQICDALESKGIRFESSMISNAILLTESLAHKARIKWRLLNVQVTLDGTSEVYNRTKNYVGIEGNPFDQVMDNIECLLKESIQVIIRLNVGIYNIDDLVNLIRQISERFKGQRQLSVYPHELFQDAGYIPVHHEPSELEIIETKRRELEKYIIDEGLVLQRNSLKGRNLPALKIFYCMADNPTSVMINPDGHVGKCEHDLYTHLIGSVESSQIDRESAEYWRNSNVRPGCSKCALFPMCGIPQTCKGGDSCRDSMMHRRIENVQERILDVYQANGNSVLKDELKEGS